jgi:hypothetical protein
MTTLDEISKQVESLRAEVAELKARPPSIVVNRGDQLVVQYANPVQPQVILECKAAPEKPAEPQPIDGKVGDIYEWDDKKWRLTKWAPAPDPSTFIANSHLSRKEWYVVFVNTGANPSSLNYRWHVEEVAEPAPPKPKCPACGGEMMILPHGSCYRCRVIGCELIGPSNDPDGSKVRKLRNIDKMPKVTADEIICKRNVPSFSLRNTFNHFAGHIIVANKPTKGE